MAIAYRSDLSASEPNYSADFSSGASPYTVTLQGTTTENDIVLLFWGISNSSGSTPTVACSGFTNKGTVNTATGAHAGILWKRAGNGEYSYSVSASGTAGSGQVWAAVFRGCVTTGDPFDAYQTASGTSAGSGAIPSVAVTTTVPNTTLVWVVNEDQGWAAGVPPTGFTEIADNNKNIQVAYKNALMPGTQTASGATHGTATPDFVVALGALKPASNGFFSMF